MSERIHALAYNLFGKASVEECDIDEVRHLATQHPYFAPAQFLLLQKLKQTGSPEYTAQMQKAVLFYHNPLEFEFFINSDRFYTELVFDEKENATSETTEVVENVTEERNEPADSVEQITKDEAPEPETNFTKQEETDVTEPGEENHLVTADMQTENELPPVDISNLKLQTSNADTELTFEPFHTVDYFASQGIKLSQEEVGKDKFGKQLKSFTEWLKSMKRLPAPDVHKPETVSEQKVQHLAEGSVHQADVVTEAMAEVWLKQGNTQKAIETYNKLSLLNPSKKAYFAAKIDNLKST
jgi:hypothetical protein